MSLLTLLSLYNFSVLFLNLSLTLSSSSLIQVPCVQSHFDGEKGIMIRHKQRTGKTLVFPGLQASLAEALLWAIGQCAETSLVLTMSNIATARPPVLCWAAGFYPCRTKFYTADIPGLTPPRLTQVWFVNQKINLLIYSGSDSAIIYFSHAIYVKHWA